MASEAGGNMATYFQMDEPVLREDAEPVLHVDVVVRCPDGIEVVSPAGDLEAVEPPLPRKARHLLERQVRPLPGEQRHGPRPARASLRQLRHAATPGPALSFAPPRGALSVPAARP